MIKKGSVVSLSYVLKDDEGTVLDRADTSEPFHYLHGYGNVVPGLEKALDGMKTGDKKAIEVGPEDGYGVPNEALQLAVPRSQFPADVELEVGMQFQSEGPEGGSVVFEIVNLVDNEVHVDGNHPLAGETLNFDVEILEVRDATTEELSHGHAHGPGGHNHH